MSRNARIGLLFVLLLVATACAAPETPVATTFADDLSFLEQHTEIVLLHDAENRALVAVAPEYQGRVMTSTAEGDAGPSLGWIHRPGISADEYQPHMNVFGGEDRFWLGLLLFQRLIRVREALGKEQRRVRVSDEFLSRRVLPGKRL